MPLLLQFRGTPSPKLQRQAMRHHWQDGCCNGAAGAAAISWHSKPKTPTAGNEAPLARWLLQWRCRCCCNVMALGAPISKGRQRGTIGRMAGAMALNGVAAAPAIPWHWVPQVLKGRCMRHHWQDGSCNGAEWRCRCCWNSMVVALGAPNSKGRQ